MDAVLSTDQVAERLDVDKKTVLRYLSAGKLEGVKLGRQWRIYRSSVDALLRPSGVPPPAAGPCRITAIVNQKGGVGKTTTAINLAVALHLRGRRVLAVDMDPQAALTVGLGLPVSMLERSVYQLLCDDELDPRTAIRATESGVDVLPATLDLAAAEVELQQLPGRELVLRDLLKKVRGSYDHVLVDTSPTLGLLTQNALCAADQVLVPVQAEFLSVRGLAHLMKTISLVQRRLNPDLKIAGFLPSIYDKRMVNAQDVLRELESSFPGQVYGTPIRYSVRLKEAPAFGRSIFAHEPRGDVAQAYSQLAEVFDRG
jgi:chromosome partitioning protein